MFFCVSNWILTFSNRLNRFLNSMQSRLFRTPCSYRLLRLLTSGKPLIRSGHSISEEEVLLRKGAFPETSGDNVCQSRALWWEPDRSDHLNVRVCRWPTRRLVIRLEQKSRRAGREKIKKDESGRDFATNGRKHISPFLSLSADGIMSKDGAGCMRRFERTRGPWKMDETPFSHITVRG